MDAFQKPNPDPLHSGSTPGGAGHPRPQVKTARNLFALPILEPQSEAWFAQNLDDFLAAYDWTYPWRCR
ncbi:outer membrane N-deacetylase [Klebsiella variicola]|nr:outer membrane N-deacetylase [Klebsiella variicola]